MDIHTFMDRNFTRPEQRCLAVLGAFIMAPDATCPDCGENTGPLTNGIWICDKGHQHGSRAEIEGLKWWHGRATLSLSVVLIAFLVFYTAARVQVNRVIRDIKRSMVGV